MTRNGKILCLCLMPAGSDDAPGYESTTHKSGTTFTNRLPTMSYKDFSIATRRAFTMTGNQPQKSEPHFWDSTR
jgi:hypothetical protein